MDTKIAQKRVDDLAAAMVAKGMVAPEAELHLTSNKQPGALIYAKAYPEHRIPNFYDSNARALADIRERAASDPVEA